MPTGLGDEKLWISATNDNTGTSTAFNDQSGNSNNGTATGTTVVADTSEGGTYAFDFDGVDDHITGSTLGSGTTDDICVAMWLNLDVWGSEKYLFSLNGSGSSSANNSLDGYITQTNILYSFTRPNPSVTQYTYSSGAGNWFHLCFNREAGTGTIDYYIDGVKVESAAGNSDSASLANGYVLGGFASGQDQYKIDGKVDDFRVFERSLTQAEITHLASSRGVEGPPPVGLGDEQLWLCPSLNDSANDISGSGNDGTYQGSMGTVLSDGKLAYDFDGVDDYIDTGSTTVHQNTVFTYSLWLKINSTATSDGVMGSYEFSSGDRGPLLVTNAESSHGIWYYQSNGSQFNSLETLGSTLNVFDNTWRHVVCVFNGMNNTAKFYRDGVLLNEAVTNVPNTVNISTSFKIGAGAGQYVAGLIDDARVYNRELSQAEITHLASQRGVEGPPPVGLGDEQLWLCPSLNDSANDISGSGNDGTYQGGTGTVLSDGKLAYDFDGVDDRVEVSKTNFSFLRETNQWAQSAWVRADSISGQRVIIGGDADNSQHGTLLYSESSGSTGLRGLRSVGNVSAYSPDTESGTDLSVSQWTHVCWVVDGTTSTIYLNGTQLFQETGTFPTSSGPLSENVLIGCYESGSSFFSFFDGLMDDIRIFERALTQAEITHLASQRGVQGPAPVGLGTEKLWVSPTNSNNVNPFDDLSAVGNTMSENGGLTTVSNTDSGGTHAYDFDRSAAKGVLQSTTENIDDTDSFAASWWMNPSVFNTSTNYYIADCRSATGGSYNGWGLYLRNTGGAMKLGTAIYRGSRAGSDSGLEIGTPASSMLNVWTHCVANWDNPTSTWTLFVNGVNAGTYTPSVTGGPAVESGTHIAVGNYSAGPNSTYAPIALLDDLRVHNRVLTQAEVTHLATNRGIEGPAGGGPPASVFFNPFKSQAFHTLTGKRIR